MTDAEKEAVKKRLNDLELRALDHMRHYRFFEAFGLMELWAILHKESGLRRPSPFQPFAALAQQKYRQKINREVE